MCKRMGGSAAGLRVVDSSVRPCPCRPPCQAASCAPHLPTRWPSRFSSYAAKMPRSCWMRASSARRFSTYAFFCLALRPDVLSTYASIPAALLERAWVSCNAACSVVVDRCACLPAGPPDRPPGDSDGAAVAVAAPPAAGLWVAPAWLMVPRLQRKILACFGDGARIREHGSAHPGPLGHRALDARTQARSASCRPRSWTPACAQCAGSAACTARRRAMGACSKVQVH
jgi:hypothetical protein